MSNEPLANKEAIFSNKQYFMVALVGENTLLNKEENLFLTT